MNKRILGKILLIVIFAFAIWMFTDYANAAYISISLDKTTASPGETISGTISSDCVGRVNLSSSNGTISTDKVWIEGGSQSFTITVGNSGTASISASPEGGVMSSGGTDITVEGASTIISIATSNGSSSSGGSTSDSSSSSSSGSTTGVSTTSTSEQESSNANLSNLGIRPNDFSGFTPGTTTYNVTVPEDVETVEVYATAQDSGATISGTGNQTLEYGENALSVVVTAEDGTTKTYTINVTREGEEATEEETEMVNGLSSITIGDLELSPSFQTDVYEYTVRYIGEDTSLNIETVATDPSYTVEILGNEELKEGENIITILVADSEGNNVATYQLTVNKSLVDEEALAREEEERQQQEQRRMFIIAGGIIALILIIVIIIVVKRRRNRAYAEEFSGVPFAGINDDEDYYDDYDNYDNYDNYDDYDNDNQFDNYNDELSNEQNEFEDYDNENLLTEETEQVDNQETNRNLDFDDSEEQREKEKAKRDFLEGYNSDYTDDFEEDKSTRGRKRGKRFK